jgi:hypothetical protein
VGCFDQKAISLFLVMPLIRIRLPFPPWEISVRGDQRSGLTEGTLYFGEESEVLLSLQLLLFPIVRLRGCQAYQRGTNSVDTLTKSWIAGSDYTESYPTLGADWITPTPISMLDGNLLLIRGDGRKRRLHLPDTATSQQQQIIEMYATRAYIGSIAKGGVPCLASRIRSAPLTSAAASG